MCCADLLLSIFECLRVDRQSTAIIIDMEIDGQTTQLNIQCKYRYQEGH